MACGPTTGPATFEVRPVSLTPCALTPMMPASVKQGETVRIPLGPSRSDVSFAVVTIPAGAEATMDGDVLVYRPGYETVGSAVVEVAFTCAGKTTQVVVTLPVANQVRWGTPVTWSVGPDAREHPSLFLDAASPDTLWLYGGFSFVPRQFTVTNDLWKLDLRTNTWTKVDTQNAPLLAGGRIARGTTPGEFFLFGGQTPADEVSSDVFRFDVTQTPVSFVKLTTMGPAPVATLGAFMHDAARQRLITFGGYTGAGVSNAIDQLTLDASPTWSSKAAAPGPSPRYGFFTALDGDRLIVFSGAQAPKANNPINPAGDVWSLDLPTLTWTKLAEPTEDAPGRRNGCGALDPLTHRFFVWSGTPDGLNATPMLSVLDLARTPAVWSRVTTPSMVTARGSCSAIFDAARKRVLFGFGNTTGAQFADLQVLELGAP